MIELNVFWPVYKQLESRAVRLTEDIHVCDDQLEVYSSTIADIVIRCGVELEAIVKELYVSKTSGVVSQEVEKSDVDHLRFDDLLKALRSNWHLDKKVVYISHYSCFQSQKVLYPFLKDTPRTGKSGQTFAWNNAYQNLKHDRQKYLSSGCLRNMFSALAATYLLNLYLKDETLLLGHDCSPSAVDSAMGSELFSIEVARDRGWDSSGDPNIPENYEACAVVVTSTEETRKKAFSAFSAAQAEAHQFSMGEVLVAVTKDQELTEAKLRDTHISSMRKAFANPAHLVGDAMKSLEYEARMNKHNLMKNVGAN
ncbi:hypothetical protein [Roseibium sp. Sym1]|uniref:hypothetical protein n=1 Tax=Roseibium sp. Sym1 TaxID=3016006 RepID=UPI0022B4CFC8|nr:hypothetical protein [Roseibium sp. Sym1]